VSLVESRPGTWPIAIKINGTLLQSSYISATPEREFTSFIKFPKTTRVTLYINFNEIKLYYLFSVPNCNNIIDVPTLAE
jgi:hypothetical protein